MRALEKCLFVVGAICFGASLAGVLPLFLMVLSQGGFGPRGGPDMIGGDGLLLVLLAMFGAGFGAFVGLLMAAVRLWRGTCRPWTVQVRVGVILGLMVGLALATIGAVANAPGFGKAPRGPLDTIVQVILSLLSLGKPFTDLLEIRQIHAALIPGLGMFGGIIGSWIGRARTQKPGAALLDGWDDPGEP